MKKNICILSAFVFVLSVSGCQNKPNNADVSNAEPPKTSGTITEQTDAQKNVDNKEINPGDVITFGHYEQDNNIDNGTEPIEWQVLSVDGDDVFVWSSKVLDNKYYNDQLEDVTWETCSLRKWLNEEFYQTAFSASEQSAIIETRNTTPGDENVGADGGNDTDDYVFVLSVEEVNQFYTVDPKTGCSDLKIRPTKYAHDTANYVTKMYAYYWLRSPRSPRAVKAAGGDYGAIGECGITYEKYGVRPAMHLSLSSLSSL